LEFNVPFQHKYGYIRDEQSRLVKLKLACNYILINNVTSAYISNLVGNVLADFRGLSRYQKSLALALDVKTLIAALPCRRNLLLTDTP